MTTPEPRRLGHGLHLLPLPLPIPRLPSVNCYVFESEGSLVLIDPGGGHTEGYEALRGGLADLGHSLADVRAAVCTHLHPDHMGLATRLVEETGCDYVMHRSAADRMDGYNDWAPFRERIMSLAARHGAPPEQVEAMGADEPRPDWAPPSMPPTSVVDDGDTIAIGPDRHLEVVHTPGHEASHICLRDGRTGALFSGDHVLPRITPFVPFPDDEPDNLGTYLGSLARVAALDPSVTYPAHLDVIRHGADRARQIALHHERRLDSMLDTLQRRPRTAWDVMEGVFKPHLPPRHLRLALQETLAHLEYLRVRHRLDASDDDGVVVYHLPR